MLGLLASGLLAASASAFALEECARRGQAYLLTFTGGWVGGWRQTAGAGVGRAGAQQAAKRDAMPVQSEDRLNLPALSVFAMQRTL